MNCNIVCLLSIHFCMAMLVESCRIVTHRDTNERVARGRLRWCSVCVIIVLQ